MGTPVLIFGRSGTGKTTSLRNFKNALVLNVMGKPLPFKQEKSNDLIVINANTYELIKNTLLSASKKDGNAVIIDDAGYLMTDQFMNGHSVQSKGNSVFELYNLIGDNFYGLIQFVIKLLPKDQVVYFIMHEEQNDFGQIKPKSIGKMLDEKVCLEGLFTIALHSVIIDKKYCFATQTDGLDVAKSPMGMFDSNFIDNDLYVVDKKIREFYDLKESLIKAKE